MFATDVVTGGARSKRAGTARTRSWVRRDHEPGSLANVGVPHGVARVRRPCTPLPADLFDRRIFGQVMATGERRVRIFLKPDPVNDSSSYLLAKLDPSTVKGPADAEDSHRLPSPHSGAARAGGTAAPAITGLACQRGIEVISRVPGE